MQSNRTPTGNFLHFASGNYEVYRSFDAFSFLQFLIHSYIVLYMQLHSILNSVYLIELNITVYEALFNTIVAFTLPVPFRITLFVSSFAVNIVFLLPLYHSAGCLSPFEVSNQILNKANRSSIVWNKLFFKLFFFLTSFLSAVSVTVRPPQTRGNLLVRWDFPVVF